MNIRWSATALALSLISFSTDAQTSTDRFADLRELDLEHLIAILAPDVYDDPQSVRIGELPEPLRWFIPVPHRLLLHASRDQLFFRSAVVTFLDGRPQMRALADRIVSLGWEEVPHRFLEGQGHLGDLCLCGDQGQACAHILRENGGELDVRIQFSPLSSLCRADASWRDEATTMRPPLLETLESELGACFENLQGPGGRWSRQDLSIEVFIEAKASDAFDCAVKAAEAAGLRLTTRPSLNPRHRAALVDWKDTTGTSWSGVLRTDNSSADPRRTSLSFTLRRGER